MLDFQGMHHSHHMIRMDRLPANQGKHGRNFGRNTVFATVCLVSLSVSRITLKVMGEFYEIRGMGKLLSNIG